jgi:hypothetical protein
MLLAYASEAFVEFVEQVADPAVDATNDSNAPRRP